MGVPVLTLCGDRLLARQSASIFQKNVGLDDWIANSQGEYLAKSPSGIPQNIDALAPSRRTLRQRLDSMTPSLV